MAMGSHSHGISRRRVGLQLIVREEKLSTQSSCSSMWIAAKTNSKDETGGGDARLRRSLPVSNAQPYSQNPMSA